MYLFTILPWAFILQRVFSIFSFHLFISFFITGLMKYCFLCILGSRKTRQQINQIIHLFNSTYTRLATESIRHTMVCEESFNCFFSSSQKLFIFKAKGNIFCCNQTTCNEFQTNKYFKFQISIPKL